MQARVCARACVRMLYNTNLSCFPGSWSWILHRSAALISSSFFSISLCRPDTQSWATVGFTFCTKAHSIKHSGVEFK